MPTSPLTYQQSVFKRYNSDKHLSDFYLPDGSKNQLAEIWNDYYVTVTLCIGNIRREPKLAPRKLRPYGALFHSFISPQML